jgi:hypothetical protein
MEHQNDWLTAALIFLAAAVLIVPLVKRLGPGAWAAEIQARAGASCGASLGAGEALDRPQQRAGNNGWPRKWPRPSGLAPQWGRCVVIPLARGAAPGGALRLASPPLRG